MINRSGNERIPVNGLLLLDKPSGLSSNQALARAKRLLQAKKGGHTGALDPIATGLLPLCFGNTTRIAGIFLNFDKTYQVSIRLGETTETGDTEGEVVSRSAVNANIASIEQALDRFRGKIQQLPPMYSALKKDGVPLYKLARKNQIVERDPREVTVHKLEVIDYIGNNLSLIVKCSKGFYIRSLAMDLGEVLRCGGHVQVLRRVEVGKYSVHDAITLEELEAMPVHEERHGYLTPTDQALNHLVEFKIPKEEASSFCQGQPIPLTIPRWEGLGRIYSADGIFLGLGECDGVGNICPRKVFA
ncbi:MAG: tRNA pseudouridine(55) synthase TruB [Gammaproteobacteria bacterium]|nr:tRNA pseudouridine(55) synthase TruB [Gammaproteobacteria bacterium]MCY4228659.1 tRNA pseudouridine(55) synthase TruB [Gammaproteobacteria bacterium]